MPYNLPTNNKIDVKLINLRLKEYVEERARIKDESAKKAFFKVKERKIFVQNGQKWKFLQQKEEEFCQRKASLLYFDLTTTSLELAS